MKTCPCGHTGGLADFEQFDALCRPCRAEKGPRRRKGGRVLLQRVTPEPAPPPEPTGRQARRKRIRGRSDYAEAIA